MLSLLFHLIKHHLLKEFFRHLNILLFITFFPLLNGTMGLLLSLLVTTRHLSRNLNVSNSRFTLRCSNIPHFLLWLLNFNISRSSRLFFFVPWLLRLCEGWRLSIIWLSILRLSILRLSILRLSILRLSKLRLLKIASWLFDYVMRICLRSSGILNLLRSRYNSFLNIAAWSFSNINGLLLAIEWWISLHNVRRLLLTAIIICVFGLQFWFFGWGFCRNNRGYNEW